MVVERERENLHDTPWRGSYEICETELLHQIGSIQF